MVMKIGQKMISLLMAVAIVFACAPSAFAANHPFTDVPDGTWYSKAVEYVYQEGLMSGVSSTKFGPYETVSRAMLVTILYRTAGSPDVSGVANPFRDVADDAYYSAAVRWAHQNGIVSGTSSTTFSPNNAVTREQIVAILYRDAQYRGKDVSVDGDVSGFADYGQIAGYARVPMAWAVENGIMSGVGNNKLDPKGSTERCACAVLIRQYIGWINGEVVEKPVEPSEPEQNEIAGVDPRFEVWEGVSGSVFYKYNSFCVVDNRSWGDTPILKIIDNTSISLTYYKQDGTAVNVLLESYQDYSLICNIQEDGTYTIGFVGDYDD